MRKILVAILTIALLTTILAFTPAVEPAEGVTYSVVSKTGHWDVSGNESFTNTIIYMNEDGLGNCRIYMSGGDTLWLEDCIIQWNITANNRGGIHRDLITTSDTTIYMKDCILRDNTLTYYWYGFYLNYGQYSDMHLVMRNTTVDGFETFRVDNMETRITDCHFNGHDSYNSWMGCYNDIYNQTIDGCSIDTYADFETYYPYDTVFSNNTMTVDNTGWASGWAFGFWGDRLLLADNYIEMYNFYSTSTWRSYQTVSMWSYNWNDSCRVDVVRNHIVARNCTIAPNGAFNPSYIGKLVEIGGYFEETFFDGNTFEAIESTNNTVIQFYSEQQADFSFTNNIVYNTTIGIQSYGYGDDSYRLLMRNNHWENIEYLFDFNTEHMSDYWVFDDEFINVDQFYTVNHWGYGGGGQYGSALFSNTSTFMFGDPYIESFRIDSPQVITEYQSNYKDLVTMYTGAAPWGSDAYVGEHFNHVKRGWLMGIDLYLGFNNYSIGTLPDNLDFWIIMFEENDTDFNVHWEERYVLKDYLDGVGSAQDWYHFDAPEPIQLNSTDDNTNRSYYLFIWTENCTSGTVSIDVGTYNYTMPWGDPDFQNLYTPGNLFMVSDSHGYQEFNNDDLAFRLYTAGEWSNRAYTPPGDEVYPTPEPIEEDPVTPLPPYYPIPKPINVTIPPSLIIGEIGGFEQSIYEKETTSAQTVLRGEIETRAKVQENFPYMYADQDVRKKFANYSAKITDYNITEVRVFDLTLDRYIWVTANSENEFSFDVVPGHDYDVQIIRQYQLYLQEGQNLISIPYETDMTTETLINDPDIGAVTYKNEAGDFVSVLDGFGVHQPISAYDALYVYAFRNKTLVLEGWIPSVEETDRGVEEAQETVGWEMTGLPIHSTFNQSVSIEISQLLEAVNGTMLTYRDDDGEYHTFIVGISIASEDIALAVGEGYFVRLQGGA